MACGGGGSSGTTATMAPMTGDPTTPPTPMVRLEDLPAYAIDVAMARTHVGGTVVENMTDADIIPAVQAMADAADTLRIGDVIQSGVPGVGTDIKSSCSGKSCTANIPSVGTLTFSLTDIEDLSLVDDTANLVGFNSETQIVMEDNGITTAQSRSAARQDDGTTLTFQSYGGWLDDSAFGAEVLRVTEGATATNHLTSFSFGEATSPSSNPSGTTNSVVWRGSAVGIELNQIDIIDGFWQGDVEVDIDDLSNPDVDVSITNGIYVNFAASASIALEWEDMSLENGIFQHSNGDVNVWGTFYGDNHGEVGGTFDTNRHTGAFGATRKP